MMAAWLAPMIIVNPSSSSKIRIGYEAYQRIAQTQDVNAPAVVLERVVESFSSEPALGIRECSGVGGHVVSEHGPELVQGGAVIIMREGYLDPRCC